MAAIEAPPSGDIPFLNKLLLFAIVWGVFVVAVGDGERGDVGRDH